MFFTWSYSLVFLSSYTQHNGVVERKDRHVVECALTMLSHSHLPPSYWSFAVSTIVHIINRLPTPNLNNQTPREVLFLSKLDITHLRTFGCICFSFLKALQYPQTSTTHHILHISWLSSLSYIYQDPITSQLYNSSHVLFMSQNSFLFSPYPMVPIQILNHKSLYLP